MVKQFVLTLMNRSGLRTHIVNCTDEFSARMITLAIFPNFRVIEVVENN